MNFNVYLDRDTGVRLKRLAKARRTTRNALIREAVATVLGGKASAAWPDVVREFTGNPATRRFEATRRDLRRPSRDPLR